MIETKNTIQIETIEKEGDPIKILKGRKTDSPNYDNFNQSMTFQFKHDTIKQRVKSILMFDKFSRKNDLWLYLLYLVKMDFIDLKINIKQFNKVNPPESISRSRRLIYKEIKEGNHKELKYLIDKDMEEIRKEEEGLYRGYIQDKNNANYARRIK